MYMWNLKAVMTKELCESSRQLRRHVSETKSVLYCWSSQYDRVLRWQDLDITDEIIYLANPMSLSHNDVIKRETFFVWNSMLHNDVIKRETFFVLLALCERNPVITRGFPSQRPVTWNFDVFLVLCLNKKLLNKRSKKWIKISLVSFDVAVVLMTSSNENISRVTGHLCGEFTFHRWIPRTKTSDAEFWCFLWSGHE